MTNKILRDHLKEQFGELQARIKTLEKRMNELYELLYRSYEVEDANAAFLHERDIVEVRRNLGVFYNMRRRAIRKIKDSPLSV